MQFSITQLAVTRGGATKLDLIAGAVVEAWRDAGARTDRKLDDDEAFVLTRAVLGMLRAAVLEDSPAPEDAGFEDAVVRLVLGFLRNPGTPVKRT